MNFVTSNNKALAYLSDLVADIDQSLLSNKITSETDGKGNLYLMIPGFAFECDNEGNAELHNYKNYRITYHLPEDIEMAKEDFLDHLEWNSNDH